MRNLYCLALLGLGLSLLPGCLSAKKFRDYCDKCTEGFTEEGCKAAARSEKKTAKVLNCVKEFKDLSDCLDGASCTGADECTSEADKYDTCTCKAGLEDTTYCQ